MYDKIQLSNGLKVVAYPMQGMRSVSIGIWVNAGSAYENTGTWGLSHFVEHMLFKGTETRTAKDLADQVDDIGGQINAFTSKECTSYYMKVLDTHLDKAVDILADMLLQSVFDPTEIEKEKNVVLDEIASYEDSPEDVVYDLLAEVIYQNHPLGSPILGTQQSVKDIDRNKIDQLRKERYSPENLVISVAGSYEKTQMLELLEKAFGSIAMGKLAQDPPVPAFHKGWAVREKDTEQTHLCIGFKGVPFCDDDLYPLMVLNNILGGGTSSRLFQRVREDEGLAYSIYSHPSLYKDNGITMIYASFVPENLHKVVEGIAVELKSLRNHCVKPEEIYRGKEQLKGNYILGLESTGSFMSMMGKSELLAGNIETIDEVIDKIDRVTESEVYRMADEIFACDQLALALVGRVEKEDGRWAYEYLLNKGKGEHKCCQ